MARPEYLWRGEPSFRQAITRRAKAILITLAGLFLLGWVLSYIITGLSPYILMYGSLLWVGALMLSARSRQLSGYKRVSYVVISTDAVILVVEPVIGDRKSKTQARVVGKWPLDGSFMPEISGPNIFFSPQNEAQKPELKDGFLYLANPKQALNALQKQISLNR